MTMLTDQWVALSISKSKSKNWVNKVRHQGGPRLQALQLSFVLSPKS